MTVPDLVRQYKRLAEVDAGSPGALRAYADLKAAVLALRMGKHERRALARVFKPSPGHAEKGT